LPEFVEGELAPSSLTLSQANGRRAVNEEELVRRSIELGIEFDKYLLEPGL
jgi:hypothetical protein